MLNQFNRCTAEVAEQEDCLIVDLLDAYRETDRMIHYDGVHANDLGHRAVAKHIFEVLARHRSCLAKRTKGTEKTSPRWRDESCLTLDGGQGEQRNRLSRDPGGAPIVSSLAVRGTSCLFGGRGQEDGGAGCWSAEVKRRPAVVICIGKGVRDEASRVRIR